MSRRLIALLAAFGCTDDAFIYTPDNYPDRDGNDNADNPAGGDLRRARQLFDTGVFPVLVAKCSGGACHAQSSSTALISRFVATDPDHAWSTATNFTAVVGNHSASLAPVLTKITAAPHFGLAYTADETAAIVAWLDAEVEIRNGQLTVIPDAETLSAAAERVQREFVACMRLEDFEAAKMAQAVANLVGLNNQACTTCHAAGEAGFVALGEAPELFAALTTSPSLLIQYLSVDLTGGAAAAKMIVNRSSVLGVATGQDPHRDHPRFNPTHNAGMTALTQLYNQTMARKAAGTCNLSSATLVD